jgi:membrane associated rhomboid family serine protease
MTDLLVNQLVDDIPWITLALAVGMGIIHIVSPAVTPLSYTVLAPWMHAGFNHISQNLILFVLLGAWIERRVGWATFLFSAVTIPYIALYLPVVFEYGGLSRGASGLTKMLAGYAIPVLFVNLARRTESFEFNWREIAVGFVTLCFLSYLLAGGWLTVQRFVGLEPRPDSVAVPAHLTGLVLGILWFSWRAFRHGLTDA